MVTPRSTETCPSSGCSSFMIMRNSVDLPAPLGPTRPTFSPLVTIKNSTLIATDTAVVADLGSRVDLQGVTIRVGEGRPSLDGTTGLRADAGAVIDAHDLTMSFGGSGPVGTAVAVDARVAGKVSLTNATIRGPYKVRVDMLGQIDVTSSKLRAEVEGDASHVRGIEVVSPPAPPSTAASSPSTAPPPPAKQPRSAPAPKPSPTPKPAPESGDLNWRTT
jgi:cell division septation protein DedD